MQDRILKWALITLGALNIADYLLTLRAVYILGVPEGNPAMDALLGVALTAYLWVTCYHIISQIRIG